MDGMRSRIEDVDHPMSEAMIDREWAEWVEKLKAFRLQFGHLRVPPNWPGDTRLAKWVAAQRNGFHLLPLERFEDLYRIGFDFGSERYWVSRFFQLVDFKRRFGHCNVPINWADNPQLGHWLSGQRLGKARLSVARRKLFDVLGMDWAPLQTAWTKRYAELRAFRAAHGHCNVPADWPENPELALWVGNQRHRPYQKTRLQKRLLNRLGFDWNPFETRWKLHFRQLQAFQRRFGHCNVPAKWEENPTLGNWIAEIRVHGEKAVAPKWKRRLDALGFVWEPAREQWWETRFRELEDFKKEFGHCNVPKAWPANSALGDWVSTQRTLRRELSPERRDRLERLGFVWQLIPMSERKSWEERLEELRAFKARFGHCEVPKDWPENQPLAAWVSRQRGRDKPKLTPGQKRRLDVLGFCWAKREANWEERYAQLVAFKKRHGHADVPKDWPQNPELGGWVLHQRYRKHTLGPERIEKLDALGFRWPVAGVMIGV